MECKNQLQKPTNMKDVFYIAWQYLVYNKLKTIILVLSIALIVFLPIGLNVVVDQSARSLTERAATTPLILGAKGSPLELVLNSLYLESDMPETMPFRQYTRISAYNLSTVIPLNTSFKASQQPIVGTSLDYFEFRDLELASGRTISFLGECVLGAKAAEKLEASVGGSIMSTPANVFNLAGIYPLKMSVVGVLKPTGSPDDEAVFVDIKTAWAIEGLAHGHQDLSKPEAASGVLKKEGNTIIGNASVKQYNEITPQNMDSFHFHGNDQDFPLTGIIVLPTDEKAATLLRGKYLSTEETVQLVKPIDVMNELLSTIFTIQNYVVIAVVLVGLSTLATSILVFLLSLRLRKREILTIKKIGGSRSRIFAILASEIVVVLLMGIVVAAILTGFVSFFGATLINELLLN